jgi:ribulose bisphosphate carboxylase small subunit
VPNGDNYVLAQCGNQIEFVIGRFPAHFHVGHEFEREPALNSTKWVVIKTFEFDEEEKIFSLISLSGIDFVKRIFRIHLFPT